MNKLKMVWEGVKGFLNPLGSWAGNVADYIFKIVNEVILSFNDKTKEGIQNVIGFIKPCLDVLLKISGWIPTKWQLDYQKTVEALKAVVDALADLNISDEEALVIKKEWVEAYEEWMKD